MPPRDLDEIRRLEQRVRELRRGRPINPESQRHNERVAEGLRVMGDVIRWLRTGEQLGEGVPIARQARVGQIVEEFGLNRAGQGCADRAPTVD